MSRRLGCGERAAVVPRFVLCIPSASGSVQADRRPVGSPAGTEAARPGNSDSRAFAFGVLTQPQKAPRGSRAKGWVSGRVDDSEGAGGFPPRFHPTNQNWRSGLPETFMEMSGSSPASVRQLLSALQPNSGDTIPPRLCKRGTKERRKGKLTRELNADSTA